MAPFQPIFWLWCRTLNWCRSKATTCQHFCCSKFETGSNTMPPQHSDTAFILRLNLCWCIHKAGQECATGTHRSGNQSFLPSAYLRGLNPHCEVAVSSRSRLQLFFPLFFVSVDLNRSCQDAPYLRDDVFSHTHLCCRTNETDPRVFSTRTLREVRASLVYYEW